MALAGTFRGGNCCACDVGCERLGAVWPGGIGRLGKVSRALWLPFAGPLA